MHPGHERRCSDVPYIPNQPCGGYYLASERNEFAWQIKQLQIPEHSQELC